MIVVVMDSNNIAGEADFPSLNLGRYGWEQFPELGTEEAIIRCWRAEVIVTAGEPVNREIIEKSFKLKMIVSAGESYDHIDMEAAAERGIKISNTPGLFPDNPETTRKLCRQVVSNINAFLKESDMNLVT
jgi:phosphoglycerate dehydrogenase-like enzyme